MPQASALPESHDPNSRVSFSWSTRCPRCVAVICLRKLAGCSCGQWITRFRTGGDRTRTPFLAASAARERVFERARFACFESMRRPSVTKIRRPSPHWSIRTNGSSTDRANSTQSWKNNTGFKCQCLPQRHQNQWRSSPAMSLRGQTDA